MKLLKTLLNPLRNIGFFLLLMPFGNSFAQSQDLKMTLDKIVETTFDVKDFDVWKPLFLKDSLIQKENGVQTIVISSKIGEPHQMMNVAMVADVEKAKMAMKDAGYLERIKTRGVSNTKSVYYQVVRFDPSSKETKWVIMTHKVKDFDAWLAAFDQGKSMRTAAGLTDVLISRNIDDPSMVQIVDDIADLGKAKAFVASKILQERMKMAGVIGKPEVQFYESR